jgi:hypothetical protein
MKFSPVRGSSGPFFVDFLVGQGRKRSQNQIALYFPTFCVAPDANPLLLVDLWLGRILTLTVNPATSSATLRIFARPRRDCDKIAQGYLCSLTIASASASPAILHIEPLSHCRHKSYSSPPSNIDT